MDPLIVVTDRRQADEAEHALADVVAQAVSGGARTVLLRDKDLARAQRRRLAGELLTVLAPVAGSLLVASDRDLAQAVGAAGVHLASDAGPVAGVAAPGAGPAAASAGAAPGSLTVGRSCHSVAELAAAQREGLDYATFSPVWLTASKPGYGPALGLDGFAAGCAAVPGLPVYALGGVGRGRVAACIHAGAAGVAVMGAIMRADDPGKAVRTLLEEIP
ncbi:MAG: thiamine phosphate synthase [Acidimicrobiales bacterium]